MDNLRKYGNGPYEVLVVHGGPGACGEMAPVAVELSSDYGVLEPLQTKLSLKGQVEELRACIENECVKPVILIGFSWGAWLSLIVAAEYPELVRKLILVGSGPFEQRYAPGIDGTRLERLDERERAEVKRLVHRLKDPGVEDRRDLFSRFGELFSKADSFDPIYEKTCNIELRPDIFFSVWKEASELRRCGGLLQFAGKVLCPVVAIHGAYDPHPPKGVRDPLSAVLKDFKFFLFEKCGHKPWTERHAREQFYKAVRMELR